MNPVSVRQCRRRQRIRCCHRVEVDRSSAKRIEKRQAVSRLFGAEEIGSCSWASAADNRVATRDASRRQQTPASSVCNMPDNAIGATQADSGNRIDTSGGARLTDWKFSSPSPQLGFVEGDGQQDGAKLGRPNRGTSTDDNRRTWRKKIKVQQLALPRCHGGATRTPRVTDFRRVRGTWRRFLGVSSSCGQ